MSGHHHSTSWLRESPKPALLRHHDLKIKKRGHHHSTSWLRENPNPRPPSPRPQGSRSMVAARHLIPEADATKERGSRRVR